MADSQKVNTSNGPSNGNINSIHPDSAPKEPPETQPRGTPAIDIKCGPLLRYLGMRDTYENAWRGTILIVTNDSTSDYSSVPQLSLNIEGSSPPGQPDSLTVSAESILREYGVTFWLFALDLELHPEEQKVTYSINSDNLNSFSFFIPAKEQSMNIMFHSCNGFSFGVDPSGFKGSLWKDVLKKHRLAHFHVMLGGGDQIYCDSIKEYAPTIKKWVHEKIPHRKHNMPFDDATREETEKFYLWHYIGWFGSGFWKGSLGTTLQSELPEAMAQIPMINLFDDHDIIDGFGSYSDHTMNIPIFNGIGNVAYKYYMLFQHQTNPQHPTDAEPSWVVGASPGPYIRERSMSVYCRLGKSVSFFGLDCRTERRADQVASSSTYQQMFDRIKLEANNAHGEIKHLLLMLGVPIAYPRLVWLEKLLTSRVLYPVRAVARHGFMTGLLNQFDGSVEILDDLNDHWCAKPHKVERNWLIHQLQDLAKETNLRITILSGDVHLAGIGRFYSSNKSIAPEKDSRLIFNIISSAIVNTPPNDGMADFLNKRNKIHHLDSSTDENMVRIFTLDVDGTKRNNQRLLPRRNFCTIMDVEARKHFNQLLLNGNAGRVDSTNHFEAGKQAGPVLAYFNNPEIVEKTDEPIYPGNPSSLSVTIHLEKDRSDVKSETLPYELLVPDLIQ